MLPCKGNLWYFGYFYCSFILSVFNLRRFKALSPSIFFNCLLLAKIKKLLPYQILDVKPRKNVQLDPQTTEIWSKKAKRYGCEFVRE